MTTQGADVVVVGAGIVGLCIAYQIRRRSSRRVIVVERGAGPAEGSTGASVALIRSRYTHDEMVRLARDGLAVYRDWAGFTRLAEPAGRFHPTGVLWMLGHDTATVAAERDRLRGFGIDAQSLDAAAVRARFPALSTCAVPFDLTGEVEHECGDGEAFLFEPHAGYFTPTLACHDLVAAAEREGAEVRFRSAVTGVRRAGDRVTGVELAGGERIDCDVVVNAAGPWCNQLNRLAGLDLAWRLEPTRIQVLHRELPAELLPLPFVADAASGVYFRPEAGGSQLWAGSLLERDEGEVVDPDAFRAAADPAFVAEKIHGVHHRVPGLPHRGTLGGFAGLYTVNRDDVHPLVGPSGLDGYLLAIGFSGHGFKEAPMVAAMLARHLTGEPADFDTDVPMRFLAVDRAPLAVATKTVLA